jgi:hypothetical protein
MIPTMLRRGQRVAYLQTIRPGQSLVKPGANGRSQDGAWTRPAGEHEQVAPADGPDAVGQARC